MPSVLPPTMGKCIGNVPRLLNIIAKCIDVKFPDVRGIVDFVMLPKKDNEVEVNDTQDAPRWPRTSLTFVLHWPWRPRASGNLTSVHVALMSNRCGTLPMYLPIEGGRTEGIY